MFLEGGVRNENISPKSSGYAHHALIEAVVGFVNCRFKSLPRPEDPGAPHSVSAANARGFGWWVGAVAGLQPTPSDISRRVIPTRPKSRTQHRRPRTPGEELGPARSQIFPLPLPKILPSRWLVGYGEG